MNIALGIILGLFVLTVLVVAHEFGHFIMARKSGVRVKEFGIGFPPRAICWVRTKPEKGKKKGKWTKVPKEDWKKEQNSLIFSLNWLPIGGFCAMDGESDDESRPGTFGSVSFWKKTKILFGGVLMNWLVAFLIFTILCWTGMPVVFNNQFTIKSDEIASGRSSVTVTEVKPNSPAENAGFKEGDRLLSVSAKKPITDHKYTEEQCAAMGMDKNGSNPCTEQDTKEITSTSDVSKFNEAHASETVRYTIERTAIYKCPPCPENADCEVCSIDAVEKEYTTELTLIATLNPIDNPDGYLLGITMSNPESVNRYTWSAPVVAAGLTVQATGETFVGIGRLLVNLVTGTARQISSDESVRKEGQEQLEEAGEGVSGIVGVVGNYFPKLISSGIPSILLFSAIISISLACMNIIPIPALDGGRWLIIFLYRLRHKKLPKEKEQSIISKSLLVLIALIVIITILDIIKLF